MPTHRGEERSAILLTTPCIMTIFFLSVSLEVGKVFGSLLQPLYFVTQVVDSNNALQDLFHGCISRDLIQELLGLRPLHPGHNSQSIDDSGGVSSVITVIHMQISRPLLCLCGVRKSSCLADVQHELTVSWNAENRGILGNGELTLTTSRTI